MTDKVSKKKISDALNTLFSVDIDWSKMSQKDLEVFIARLDKTDDMIKIFYSRSENKQNTSMELIRSRVETVAIEQGTKLYKAIDQNRPLLKFIQSLRDNKVVEEKKAD